MTFKLNKLAALVGVGFGVLATSPAFAAAEGMAQSVRQLSNFGFYKWGGTVATSTLLTTADFAPNGFQVTDNASVAAFLNGSAAAQNTAVSSQPPSPVTDLAQACIGTCGFAQNDYTPHALPTTGTFSRSDQSLSGVVVGGIPNASTADPTDFEPTPASSNLLSEVQIQGSGTGTSQTTSGTGGSITFQVAAPIQVLIDFTALDYLYAVVNPAIDMFASTSLSFRLTANNVTVFSWVPDGSGIGGFGATVLSDPCSLNATVNATTLNAGVAQTFGCSGRFQALTTAFLTSGVVYNLSFAETTTANGTVVPEPGSLALVGAALAGLGLARRRRDSKAA